MSTVSAEQAWQFTRARLLQTIAQLHDEVGVLEAHVAAQNLIITELRNPQTPDPTPSGTSPWGRTEGTPDADK